MKRDPSIADSIEARIQARRAETERGESDGGERKRERERKRGGERWFRAVENIAGFGRALNMIYAY